MFEDGAKRPSYTREVHISQADPLLTRSYVLLDSVGSGSLTRVGVSQVERDVIQEYGRRDRAADGRCSGKVGCAYWLHRC